MMFGKGMKLLILFAVCLLIFVTVVAVTTIRETVTTFREGMPEFTQTYLLIDGLPANPILRSDVHMQRHGADSPG